MKTSRIKVNLPILTTRDDAELAMTELATVANARRKIIANRDAQALAIEQRCAPELAACDVQIKRLTDQLHAWTKANPDDIPKGRKSLDLANGTLGYRTGTPKLSLLSRTWNWEKVLARIKSVALTQYIRTKEEVDKEALLAAAGKNPDKKGARLALAGLGTKIVQEESFFIEPKLTDTTARQTTEAA